MWCDVVYAMVLTWHDDVEILEYGDVPRQAEIRMRPFVNLKIKDKRMRPFVNLKIKD